VKPSLWLPEDREYGHPLISAEILASYHVRWVHKAFIADFEASTGSGKDQVVRLFRHFGYRARPPLIEPRITQLYDYCNLNQSNRKEPWLVIFDEMVMRREFQQVLNASVERDKYVQRWGKPYHPYGIRVIVHEVPFPAKMKSLRRRCIRLVLSQSETFRPALVLPEEFKTAKQPYMPDLVRWRDRVSLKELFRRYLVGDGAVTLRAPERPVWALLAATLEYCDRLDDLGRILAANRTGQEVAIVDWFKEKALPLLRGGFDPAARRAGAILGWLREHLGADMPPISEDRLGKLLHEAISDRQLEWTHRLLNGGQVYELRRGPLDRLLRAVVTPRA